MAPGGRAVWRAGTRARGPGAARRCPARPCRGPAIALQAAALLLVAAAQGLAPSSAPPPAAPAPASTAALPALAPDPKGPATTTPPPAAVTTPAPPTIRHRLHVSAPPITANGSVPTAASGTTVTPVTTSWPSPTAAPRGQLPVAAAPTAPVTAKTKTATASTARPPTLQTRPTMAPPRAKLPRMTSTAMPAAPTVPKKSPTAQTVTTPSQAERPNAADATASTVAATSGRQDAVVSAASAKVAPNTRPPDDEQYPMYAEYPDVSVNLTNAGPSGGDSTEGDVVPDPDAALRQEDDERERASLAGDDPPDNMQFLGEATAVQQSPTREDIIPEDPNVGVLFGSVADIRIAGDVSGAVSGDLEAGFEHAPVEEGAVVRDDLLGMPVEPQDPDLRERDRLDGDAYRDRERAELQLHNQGAAGKQVVIVGAALALVAQFLCLASATRRMRPGHVDVSTAVLFNVELALIVENLVFMLGVQSVGEPLRCQWVALALHYLHLVAAGWFLANTAFLSYRIRARQLPAYFKPVAISVWAVPAVLVAAMYAAQPRSYETHRYCWMAVQRGMILTFVFPVAVLMTVNSFLALRGLRFACNKDEADKELVAEGGGDDRDGLRDGGLRDLKDPATPAELRSSLRAAAIMLPLYSADWFLGVVAMDNSTTLAYPLLFLVSNGFLNWFLMVCAWLIVPRESNKEAGDWCGGAEGEDLDEEEEYLMEEDDAGCWGKSSSSSASLLGNYYGDACNPGLLSNGEIVVWGIDTSDQNNSGTGDARLYGRWDEAAAATQTRDAEQLSGPGAAPGGGPGGAIPGAQELAEMRYDGAISTIST